MLALCIIGFGILGLISISIINRIRYGHKEFNFVAYHNFGRAIKFRIMLDNLKTYKPYYVKMSIYKSKNSCEWIDIKDKEHDSSFWYTRYVSDEAGCEGLIKEFSRLREIYLNNGRMSTIKEIDPRSSSDKLKELINEIK
jgi:hypothetical protein